jgi:hypothetical protein
MSPDFCTQLASVKSGIKLAQLTGYDDCHSKIQVFILLEKPLFQHSITPLLQYSFGSEPE